METNKRKRTKLFAVLCLMILVIGIIMGVIYLVKYRNGTDKVSVSLMWATIIASGAGTLLTLIAVVMLSNNNSEASEDDNEEAAPTVVQSDAPKQDSQGRRQSPRVVEPVAQTVSHQTYIVDGENITSVPKTPRDAVVMGRRQSIEEKFREISKMDKPQFVVYVARLFSYKGYQVKFTPVVDNYDIDLLAEKSGETIAVGCILADKTLGKDNVAYVKNGRSHYNAKSTIALTNTTFDKSARDYAKAERITLVDRDVLAKDYMV